MLLKVSTSDNDRLIFSDYIKGGHREHANYPATNFNDINEQAIRTKIQSCIWLIAEKFPDEWTYNTFLTEKRNDKLDQIL